MTTKNTKKAADPFATFGGALMKMPALRIAALAWGASVVEAQKQGHTLAIQALRHAMPESLGGYGDTAGIEALLHNLRDRGDGKSHAYVTGLSRWIERYSTIHLKANGNFGLMKVDDPAFAKRSKDLGETFKPWDIEAAFSDPFWRLTPAGNDVLSFDDLVKRFDPAKAETSFGKIIGDKTIEGSTPQGLSRLREALHAATVAFQRVYSVGGSNAEVGGNVAEGLEGTDVTEDEPIRQVG